MQKATRRTPKSPKPVDSMEAVGANSSKPPPPAPGGAGVKVKVKKQKVTLPRNNAANPTPSNQPTGAQVTGPHGAVMPNKSFIPPNPTPTVETTRADDKPLPKSIRSLVVQEVRKKILKTKRDTKESYTTPGKIAEAREKPNRGKSRTIMRLLFRQNQNKRRPLLLALNRLQKRSRKNRHDNVK